jgi:hypothetical protein
VVSRRRLARIALVLVVVAIVVLIVLIYLGSQVSMYTGLCPYPTSAMCVPIPSR